MNQYADNTQGWESWQLDYRFGLILIMPAAAVAELIDPLREKFDPKSHATCPVHISLSDPLGREMTPELEVGIQEILKTIEPFQLHFDRPQASQKHPGVAYPIRPEEPVNELKARLHTSSAFNKEEYSRRRIPPHLTIAEFVTIEQSLRICEELQETAPTGSFLCDRLEFIVPNNDFHFERRKIFWLGPDV